MVFFLVEIQIYRSDDFETNGANYIQTFLLDLDFLFFDDKLN